MSVTQARVLCALRAIEPCSIAELALATGIDRKKVYNALRSLRDRNEAAKPIGGIGGYRTTKRGRRVIQDLRLATVEPPQLPWGEH